jgi:hypothetical protein
VNYIVEILRRRVRLAKARRVLSDSVCTCDGKHDPFWVHCPRTIAQIEYEQVLAVETERVPW